MPKLPEVETTRFGLQRRIIGKPLSGFRRLAGLIMGISGGGKMPEERYIVSVEFYGYVQGVYFRKFISGNARALSLSGWVSNTDDGVEAVFEGPMERIIRTVMICARRTELETRVETVREKWEEGGPKRRFRGFEILDR